MSNKVPNYINKLPKEDHPIIWGDLPFLIEKTLYLNGVSARRPGLIAPTHDHILIETTCIDKNTGKKVRKTVFEFIEDCEAERGCILTGDNQVLFAGGVYDDKDVEKLFTQAYFMVEANHSKFIYEEAREQQKNCPQLKPVFNYVLPILRGRSK